MSRPSQIIIGLVAGFLGGAVFLGALEPPRPGDPSRALRFMLAAIAGVISVACLIPRSRPVTMRVIGLVLFAGGIFGLFHLNGRPSRAIVFDVGLLIGGASLIFTGKYSSFGAHGATFDAIEQSNNRDSQ